MVIFGKDMRIKAAIFWGVFCRVIGWSSLKDVNFGLILTFWRDFWRFDEDCEPGDLWARDLKSMLWWRLLSNACSSSNNIWKWTVLEKDSEAEIIVIKKRKFKKVYIVNF